MEKTRYFIELAYNGAGYHGWQIQKNNITVQQVMEQAMNRILQEPISLLGCGRTDTKVHAREFFAHFDCSKEIKRSFIHQLNSVLPRDIWIKEIYFPSNPRSSARFGAISRSYEYLICLSKNPFHLNLATYFRAAPDLNLMNEACSILPEYEHFEAFSKQNKELKHYRCEVFEARWDRVDDEMIRFRISANRFVRSMVRIIVGTSIQVGLGKISVQRFREILESRDRTLSAAAAPPDGLYLTKVSYPEGFMKYI